MRRTDISPTPARKGTAANESRRSIVRLGLCAAILLSAVALSRLQGTDDTEFRHMVNIFGHGGNRAEAVFIAVGRSAAPDWGVGKITEVGGEAEKRPDGGDPAEELWQSVETPAGITVRPFTDGK